MTEERIQKEYSNLLLANIEAQTIHIFYLEQSGKYSKEIKALCQQKEEVNKEALEKLSDEEKWKTIMRIKEQTIRFQESVKLLDLIDRQRDKAKRKSNETQQRLESFCKHHGIESPSS